MKFFKLSIAVLLLLTCTSIGAQDLFIDAETFQDKGGWVVDQQSIDELGSSYLLAHGLGSPVEPASTEVVFPEQGKYNIYVRTYNWTAPWYQGKGPGQFMIEVGKKKLRKKLGCTGSKWEWQYVGVVNIKERKQILTLKDLTGFDGRCDAIYFSKEKKMPPNERIALDLFRCEKNAIQTKQAGHFDLVVVGGGTAGISAAVAAARLGCKVALINNRPVLGGNNSAEVRVHLGGRIALKPYPAVGDLLKEYGHTKQGNAKPAAYYEDDKKEHIVAAEKNITLFSNYHVFKAEVVNQKIKMVTAKQIETNQRLSFEAPLFVDCTGDGAVAALAGADYRMGREAKDEFGESMAMDTADLRTMGTSVQWYSVEKEKPTTFPRFEYGVRFDEKSCEKVFMGEWTWETGMNHNTITEAEYIRDYGLMVIYSNWSFLKNKASFKEKYKRRSLKWVAYIGGKRESRRVLGDYILKEDDLVKRVFHEDGTASTSWTVDLHYPDPQNSRNFPGKEFKSIAKHRKIHAYPIPFRCLYSRNRANLMMAGRNISVTHVALGTVRVMRTTSMMGEVVGMAASLCKKHAVCPRQIYHYHLKELKALMKKGVGDRKRLNNQKFNEGGHL